MGTQQSRKTRQIAAIAAGALFIGVGATYTLASWTDSEWVWGGAEGDDGDTPGVGTSEFGVEQNRTADLSGDWENHSENPGGALTFTGADALALTPGDVVYSQVALQTIDDSVAGSVTLAGAVPAENVAAADTGDLLWDAIEVDVYTTADTSLTCDATGVASWTQIVTDESLDTGATASQDLTADGASPQLYCFVLTLPDTPENQDLQGRTIAPAWEFAAESE